MKEQKHYPNDVQLPFGPQVSFFSYVSFYCISTCWDIELNMAVSCMAIVVAVCSVPKDHLARLLTKMVQKDAKSIRSTSEY